MKMPLPPRARVLSFERCTAGTSNAPLPMRIKNAVRLLLALPVILLLAVATLPAADVPETLPLDQIKPGMVGEGRTIFAGDQIEKFDLVVLGILPNLIGPKQSIILVQLKGPNVEHTGVVAGMSGSPVYIGGKLVGALSLKFGVF